MNPLDEITLTGLRATAFHGVLDHERRDGQVFVIDVTVMLPLGDAATTDDLARTIHYGVLAEENRKNGMRDTTPTGAKSASGSKGSLPGWVSGSRLMVDPPVSSSV